LQQRVAIVPADFLVTLTKQIHDSPERIFEIYTAAKTAVRNEFAKNLGTTFDFSFEDYGKWLVDIAKFSGWGKLEWGDLDFEKRRAIIYITNSPVGNKLVGQVNDPVDHIIRGLMAGGASYAFNRDVDILETKCIAVGDPFCEFIIKPSEEFLKSRSPLVKRQLSGLK